MEKLTVEVTEIQEIQYECRPPLTYEVPVVQEVKTDGNTAIVKEELDFDEELKYEDVDYDGE